MPQAMRYTFHAGYEPPTFPSQFRATLGTDDPVALVRYAAEHGAAGILYPWASDRPQGEVERVSAALDETGLVSSCLVVGESSLHFRPIWTDRSLAGKAVLTAAVERSCRLAASLNAKIVVAFPTIDPARAEQPETLADDLVANLIDMGRLARGHGCTIGVEPMLLPGLMLQSCGAALDIIRRVGGADIGLIFDTAHVAAMEAGVMGSFGDAYDHILLLQFADAPGRVEPGAGTLDLVSIAAEAIGRGYDGLVDLEHGWSTPSARGEAEGLARVRRFDEQVRAAVRAAQETRSLQPR